MFYPAFLDLRDKQVLVVGGGTIAARKVESLLEAGAIVTVVAPEILSDLRQLADNGQIQIGQIRFSEADLDDKVLVFSATDDASTQQQVAQAARARGIWVNTADQPELCDFIAPAVVKKGDVTVAISTSGKSPALAAALRWKIDGLITENVARAAQILGEVRSDVHSQVADPDQRKRIFEKILESGLLDWIGECDDAAALERVRGMIENYK